MKKQNNKYPQIRDLIYNKWVESKKAFDYAAAIVQLQDILSMNTNKGNPSFNNIEDVIIYFCNNDKELIKTIKSKKSTHEVTMLRKKIAYVSKFYFQYNGHKITNYEIGDALGGLDHSTISYYITDFNHTLNKPHYSKLKKDLDKIIFNVD